MKSFLEATIDYLTQLIADASQIPSANIQPSQALESIGIDSIMITEMTDQLEKKLGEIPKTLFFEYQTIDDIAAFLVAKKTKALEDLLNMNHQVASPQPINEVATHAPPTEQPSLYAIVGISGAFPKADSLYEFWSNLKAGTDCIELVPKDRWDYEAIFSEDRTKPGTSYLKWGGFINDYDQFDPLFFNISKLEADTLDPQERLFMQTVHHTIENAGYTKQSLQKDKVGVFVGVMWAQYQLYGAHHAQAGSSYASIANRVSYFYNFRGPSMALDTMCSSSLASVHLACQSIANGECSMAIAGGVNITVHPNKYIFLSKTGFAASDGRCHTFGEGGDGYVPGDGVGALMIKPLHAAEQDHDYIYGVIRSSAINHDGKTNGYTVPNPSAQSEVIEAAITKANVSVEDIGYIEAHGTGTALGDPIEISALQKTFNKHTARKQFCAIGSVKSNIGHLESAAGFAAIAKTLMQMRYGQLVPSLHATPPNKNIAFADTPFVVQQTLSPWQPNAHGKRLAGVSSFGAGGSNAHLIVENYEMPTQTTALKQELLFCLSAQTENQLNQYLLALKAFITMDLAEYEATQHQVTPNHKTTSDIIEEAIASALHISRDLIDHDDTFFDLNATDDTFNSILRQLAETHGIQLDQHAISINDSIQALINMADEQMVKQPRESSTPKTSLDAYLPSMAYTLQIGREPMKCRIALISQSMDDLLSLIDLAIENQLNPHLYRGTKTAGLTPLKTDDVQALLQSNKLRKIAKKWVMGHDIDWSLGYQDNKPHKMPLPGYPFKKVRCWFTDQPVDTPLPAASFDPFPDPFFFEPQWKELTIPPSLSNQQPTSLYIYNQATNYLVGAIPDPDAYHILLGSTTQLLGQRSWEINSGSEHHSDIDNVLSIIKQVDRVEFFIDLSELGYTHQLQILYTSVACCRQIANNNITSSIRIHTINALSPSSTSLNTCYNSLVMGLMRALDRELTTCDIKVIDRCLSQPDLSSFQREFLDGHQHLQGLDLSILPNKMLQSRGGRLYQMDFQAIPVQPIQTLPILKKSGTYLIIGGLGVVGQMLCRHLTSQYHAHVVIMGRRELSTDIQNEIKALGNDHGSVDYHAIDIGNETAVSTIFQEWERNHPTCDGVFHLGMQYDFKKIEAMTLNDLTTSFTAKVKGSMNLIKGIQLHCPTISFVCLFASAESFIGNVGWGMYSAACLFQNALAIKLNASSSLSVPVKTINWGFWSGSNRGDESQLIDKGIYPIDQKLGMQALEHLLSSPHSQPLALHVQTKVLAKMGIIDEPKPTPTENRKEPPAVKGPTNATRKTITPDQKEALTQQLTDIIADVLKIDANEVEAETDLAEYGVDSLIVINVHKAIEDHFGELPGTLLIENMSIASLANYFAEQGIEQQADQATEASNPSGTITTIQCIQAIDVDQIPEYLLQYGDRYRDKSLLSDTAPTSKRIDSLNLSQLNHLLYEHADGRQTEVFVMGTGAPLVLIPAVALTAPVWLNQFMHLSNEYQLIAIHAPGYGLSKKIKQLDTAGVCQVYMEIIAQLCPNQRINLLTSCFGSIAGQYIAAHHPEKVERLIMSGGFYSNIGLPDIDPSKLSIDELFEMVKVVAGSIEADFNHIKGLLGDQQSKQAKVIDQAKTLLLQSQCADPLVAMKYLNELVSFSTEPWLHLIECPVLCIHGTHDTVVKPTTSSDMRDLIKQCSVQMIQQAGHYPYMTHIQAFNKIIKSFLTVKIAEEST